MSFSRIVIQPNAIFPNLRFTEHNFPQQFIEWNEHNYSIKKWLLLLLLLMRNSYSLLNNIY